MSDQTPEPPVTTPKPYVKTDDATIAIRVQEVLALLVAGATRMDVLRYASSPSKPGEQGTARPWGLTNRQVDTYIYRAHKLIEAQAEKDRGRLLRLHMTQRQDLYARAVNSGDVRAALAVVKDVDELLGFYPAKGIELTGELALRHLAEKVKGLSNEQLVALLGTAGTESNGAESAGSGSEVEGGDDTE